MLLLFGQLSGSTLTSLSPLAAVLTQPYFRRYVVNVYPYILYSHPAIVTVNICSFFYGDNSLTLSLRQAGAVSKKIFDCFFLVYWVHLNDIHQILGGWFTRCLETSMYHI